ncbi:MAG: lipase maturation factor family protein [bacterium]
MKYGYSLLERDSERKYILWWFVRGLGVISFLAFYDFHSQWPGLIGNRGILPVVPGLEKLFEQQGWGAFWDFPTLVLLYPDKITIELLCWLGMGTSVLLVVGVIPRLMCLLNWGMYLSLVVAGQKFYQYQWDTLLIETLFVSVFVVPAVWWYRRSSSPTRLGTFLLQFILAKLYFLAGFVKIGARDPAWWGGTALNYHFWTQPLPNPVSWFVHYLPETILMIGSYGALAVELIAPFLLFGPGKIRRVGIGLIAGLQISILLTGNYGLFNLLTLLLVFVALKDSELPRWMCFSNIGLYSDWLPEKPLAYIDLTVLFFLFGLNFLVVVEWFPVMNVSVVKRVSRKLQVFRTVNRYGLFGTMTKKRPEIVIQGSRDGQTWKTYRFRYKPTAVDRPPPVTGPHLPRLDWQMWFVGVNLPKRPTWFNRFIKQLLKGSKPVQTLLADVPFEERPPKYVRAEIYHYRFTGWKQGWKTGNWWERELKYRLFGPVTLEEGKLRRKDSTDLGTQ